MMDLCEVEQIMERRVVRGLPKVLGICIQPYVETRHKGPENKQNKIKSEVVSSPL